MKKINVFKKTFLINQKRLTPQQISIQRKEAIIASHADKEKTIVEDSVSHFALQFRK